MHLIKRRAFLACSTVTGLGGLAAPGFLFALPSARAQAAGKPRLRIGQIGAAHAHAEGKMTALRRSPDFEVVGIVEPDRERRRAAEANQIYQGIPWLTEEQLLNTPNLRAVAVETEVKNLLEVAARGIAADQHIHLDKPAGTSLPALKKLMAEAARRKRTVQMGYMFRYNPAFQFCFQAVQAGWLGEIISIDTVISKSLSARARAEYIPYPGGAMFELGCHVLDAVVRLLGPPQRVQAHNRTSARDHVELFDNQLAVQETLLRACGLPVT